MIVRKQYDATFVSSLVNSDNLVALTSTSHEGGSSFLPPLREKPGQGPRARPFLTVALPPGTMEGGEVHVLAGRLREL